MSDHDLPFKTEYAKSSRSSCKLCKENIGQDSLRLAKMVQSPHFDGKVPNWFHFSCFFKKCKVKTDADISGFGALRWEDQQKVKGKLEGGGAAASGASAASSAAQHEDLQVEYAKSNRSKCKGCKEQIDKDTVRLAKVMEPSPDSSAPSWVGPTPWWHHIECFIENRDELGVEASVTAESFVGFTKLKAADQEILKKKLGSEGGKKSAGKGAKRKAAAQPAPVKKQKTEEEQKEEKALKEQSQLLWKIRDELKRSCSMSVLREMLEENNQNTSGGESVLLDRCADGMAFGQLAVCPDCKEQGYFSFRSDGYACHGHLTGWTKCQNVTKDPPRSAWTISDDLKEEIEYLKKYKYKKRKRIFPTVAPTKALSILGSNISKSESTAVSSAPRPAPPDKPLFNMKFVVIGKLSQSKGDITKAIENLGGEVVEKVKSDVTCCISNKAEVVKSSKKMKDAEKAGVPVVSEDYLDAVKKGGAMLMISQHSIVSWGNKGTSVVDASPPPPKGAATGKLKKTKSSQGEQASKKIKLSVKGGAVVDPASGLEDTAHVLEDKGVIYNAVLGMVDVVRGTNSYYKLQILENDKNSQCHLFRSWGRVGTSIGGDKLERYSKEGAVRAFCQLYGEKTGNDWADRNKFVKQPNRFYPLEIDYGQDEEDFKAARSKVAPGSKSKLAKQIQELVKMIFDVDMMKKTMIEFEIDLKKMPLGKLSRRQIENAYTVLGEAQQLLSNGGSATAVLDASNRFYTLIPHDFGMKKPPLLDSVELIKTKVAMLDNLIDIEVAYSLLKSAEGEETMDPLDVEYKKLQTDMEVLERDTEEWKFIETYVKNTHADTHGQYSLNLLDVFKVSRHGERQRYKPFKELHNRRLLWHGSRTTNYAGILSQGLRIAPPEAPVTGYMFGKGVYFADMVSKSANYCRTTSTDNIGLMLLCETALGNMHELLHASMIVKPPKGKHSIKGCGRTGPDPKDDLILKDGTIVPLGKGVNTDVSGSNLLYNEYIVYDVAQIEIKYMLKLEFKYKYSW